MNEYKYFVDTHLKSNYDIILNEAIPNNWDALFIVFGKEGTGKSTFASQGARYLDPEFGLDKVAFLPEQFEKVIEKAKPGSSILWDEAITGINAANWASSVSKSVISKLTQIRKKRLKIFICFPYLHMINKYLVSRCVASMYVYSKGFKDRGYVRVYNQSQVEFLYSLMKEKYSYVPFKAIKKTHHSFFCRFSNKMCLPIDEYEDAKDKARQSEVQNLEKDKWKDATIQLLRWANVEMNIPQKKIAKATGWTQQYLSHLININKQ